MISPGGRGTFGWVCLAIAGLFAFAFLSRSLGEGFAIPVAVLSVIGATIVLRGPLGKAIARRLEGETALPADDMIAELEDLRARVLELEERVDFSERLLAQRTDVTTD